MSYSNKKPIYTPITISLLKYITSSPHLIPLTSNPLTKSQNMHVNLIYMSLIYINFPTQHYLPTYLPTFYLPIPSMYLLANRRKGEGRIITHMSVIHQLPTLLVRLVTCNRYAHGRTGVTRQQQLVAEKSCILLHQ